MKEDVISVDDVKDFKQIFDMARKVRDKPQDFENSLSKQHTLIMFFERPSTRTRIAFEIAEKQLGGNAVFFDYASSQLSRGEAIFDTSKVLSQYASIILARTYKHKTILEIQKHATVPVINGSTDTEHPTQAITDLFTLDEKGLLTSQTNIGIIGDCSGPEALSLAKAGKRLGLNIKMIYPAGYGPSEDLKGVLQSNNIDDIKECNVIYTSPWAKPEYGEKRIERIKHLLPYQVNKDLIEMANNPYIMHPLPAYRGYEITGDILDSNQSLVWEQSKNRLYIQKALLLLLKD